MRATLFASTAPHVRPSMQRTKTVHEKASLNPSDPRIKQDILRMILQYLQDEGYSASFLTVQDEANIKLAEQQGQRAQLKRARKAILEGDWTEVEKLCRRWTEDLSKTTSSQQKTFLYAIYRHAHFFFACPRVRACPDIQQAPHGQT